jgi:cholesterol oxidase
MDYDVLIIGSGFGGSVPALRLTEKGYRVGVLEQGRKVSPDDMRAADRSLRELFWIPQIGFRGFFVQHFFRHVGIVGGVGVLVYAAVLLKPGEAFFRDRAWADLGVDWKEELSTHFDTAAAMLGRTPNPDHGKMDDWLQATAEAMGAGDTFGPVPQGIYFGNAGKTEPDPFFGGVGPDRTGCTRCGGCLTGCSDGSKNSLDKNYLYLAEKLGADILPGRKVVSIGPLEGGGYEVQTVNPLNRRESHQPLRAQRVIVAAGVVGSLDLLFKCRDELRTLPEISPALGDIVRTNSEAIVAALFPPGYDFMRWYMGPLTDGAQALSRALRTITAILLHPMRTLRALFARNWHKRITVLTVMQSLDSQIAFRRGRRPIWPFKPLLHSSPGASGGTPAYIPEANEAARKLAEHIGGTPHNNVLESIGNASVTAHNRRRARSGRG